MMFLLLLSFMSLLVPAVSEFAEFLQTLPGLSLHLGSLVAAQGSNNQYASLSIDELTELVAENSADTQDYQFDKLSQLNNFIVQGLNKSGDSVTVIVPLISGETLPENALYRIYNTNNGWFSFVEENNNKLRGIYHKAIIV